MRQPKSSQKIFVSGATGFIGSNLSDELAETSDDVLCGSRNPERAKERAPEREWVEFDVHDLEVTRSALEGCDTAYYLIHEMAGGSGYREREHDAAKTFAEAADDVGLDRIIYLGGIRPDGEPSEHLASRLETGDILRESNARTVEIRCSMIIGARSASWLIVRDLAARLPMMILPRWTRSKTEPIHVDDVTTALKRTRTLDLDGDLIGDLPGPEVMTAQEILAETSLILGWSPLLIPVPLLSPKVSSLWLRFVTRANYFVAKELVEGLRHDVLAENDDFADRINLDDRMSFEEATKRSIEELGEQYW